MAIAHERRPVRPERQMPDRADRLAIRVVAIFALCVAAVFLALGTFDAIRTLLSPTVHLVADAAAPLGPVGKSPGVGGMWSEARLELSGIEVGTRILLASGAWIGALTTVIIGCAVAWLCRSLLRRDAPFTRALTRTTVVVAVVLVVLPAVSRLLHDIGANQAILQRGVHDPMLIGFGFDVTPWIVGVVLAVVGEVFRRGERLQRDTEGLV